MYTFRVLSGRNDCSQKLNEYLHTCINYEAFSNDEEKQFQSLQALIMHF